MEKKIQFEVGPGNYKYTAILPDGRRVSFGDNRYQQFKDKIGKWSNLNHNDPARRKKYRARHSAIKVSDGRRAIDVKYSPAWFSWHYLW